MDLDMAFGTVPVIDDIPVADWAQWGEQAAIAICEVRLSLDKHDSRK